VSFISSILLAFLSDVLRRHKLILRACILAMIAALLLYPHAASFATLLPIVMLYSITLSPTSSILTRTTLNTLDNPRDYGIVRMGGSIGWGIVALITGLLLNNPAFNLNIIFSLHIFFLVLLLIFSWFLPETDQPSSQSVEKASPKDIWNMLRLPAFLPWMGIIFLWGLTEASVSSFLFLHIKHLGGSPALMGTALSVSLLGEIAALAAAKRIQHKVGSRRMMILAFVVRITWFAAAAVLQEPSLILINMFIGGTSFSFIHAGGVAYVNQRAHERIGTTAQALRGSIQFGLGGGVGALISGALYQAYGSVTLYRIMACIALIGFLLALQLRSVEFSREKSSAQ
jgi:PPP family 3-phenylpropionic acid transporter